ncbi:T9SS type A sorting domain-containing protein [Flavobacterium urocaniciphilum]|uniref:Por secretion system C-terminal sorting domain-containing protein n=1 Tax=Flavobacterium urocaniciphilum TaxID=1299341 RepID=A0A1H9E1D4_9FLAO|nr:T9SS type A sorting domain-containing protein [Flavobacterium urocaniciphilum]SEQ19484.1 Por secretion system C-terminal sorting domain-containing protein [Flavobacterium urocaniciphilum]
MKKIYSLLIALLPFLGIAQGSINFDDPAKWTQGALAFTSYSNHSYVDGTFSLACTDVIRNGIAAQDGFAGGFGTYSLRLQNDATTDVTMTISSGGIGNFSFKTRRWDGSPAVDFAVEYSIDGGTIWIPSSTINAAVTPDSDWKTINGVVNSSNANVKVRVKSNSATNERLMIDDFTWTAASLSPSITINSPSNGTIYSPLTTSANIGLTVSNFNVANGTGDGHIHYTINSGSVVMKYDTAPIALTSLTPGNYTVYVELVDNSHVAIVPAVNATVTFTIAAYTVVPNLAALRADVIANGAGKYYQVSSNPVITYARTTRNQKYIQDTSAGILIDDLPGTISTAMVAGDAISGLKGQTGLFSGVLQFLPLENATVASSGNIVTPQVVTALEITNNVENYESELVQINNATFTTADGVITFAATTNYNLNDGTDIIFRTMFAESNYIGQVVPTGAGNRAVLVAEFNGVPQVVSRNNAEVTLSTTSFSQIEGLKLYPNPTKNNLYIETTLNGDINVSIINMLGKEVLNSKVTNNTVNVANLANGIYIVKVTEDGKTSTKKLIIN